MTDLRRACRSISIGIVLLVATSHLTFAQPAGSTPSGTPPGTPPAPPAPGPGDQPPTDQPPTDQPPTDQLPTDELPPDDGTGTEPETNLLANMDKDDDAAGDDKSTFGKELRFFGIETNWSGYGDVVFEAVPNQRQSTFDTTHFNPILSVRMSDQLSGELELEVEHAGLEINFEYALVDWVPLSSQGLVIRVGKFLTPIGRFNEQLHPSFRWVQIDRPLMMTEVIPVEWSQVGVQVRGTMSRRDVTFEYAAYITNGLGEGPVGADEDLEGFIATLKNNNVDNNFDKALGGRVALTSGKAEGSVSLGASGYTGKVDAAGAERMSIVDLDLYARQGGLVVNGEAAQVFFGRKGHYFDTFERGAYIQLAYIIGKTTVAGRYDYAELGAEGGPLVDYHQVAGTVKYAPSVSWSVRAEVLEPILPSANNSNTRVSAMVSFVF